MGNFFAKVQNLTGWIDVPFPLNLYAEQLFSGESGNESILTSSPSKLTIYNQNSNAIHLLTKQPDNTTELSGSTTYTVPVYVGNAQGKINIVGNCPRFGTTLTSGAGGSADAVSYINVFTDGEVWHSTSNGSRTGTKLSAKYADEQGALPRGLSWCLVGLWGAGGGGGARGLAASYDNNGGGAAGGIFYLNLRRDGIEATDRVFKLTLGKYGAGAAQGAGNDGSDSGTTLLEQISGTGSYSYKITPAGGANGGGNNAPRLTSQVVMSPEVANMTYKNGTDTTSATAVNTTDIYNRSHSISLPGGGSGGTSGSYGAGSNGGSSGFWLRY